MALKVPIKLHFISHLRRVVANGNIDQLIEFCIEFNQTPSFTTNKEVKELFAPIKNEPFDSTTKLQLDGLVIISFPP